MLPRADRTTGLSYNLRGGASPSGVGLRSEPGPEATRVQPASPRTQDPAAGAHAAYAEGAGRELQIRTKLQHAWATAVEAMGTFLGEALKAGHGPAAWRDFFATASAAIAHVESTPPVPGFEGFSKEPGARSRSPPAPVPFSAPPTSERRRPRPHAAGAMSPGLGGTTPSPAGAAGPPRRGTNGTCRTASHSAISSGSFPNR